MVLQKIQHAFNFDGNLEPRQEIIYMGHDIMIGIFRFDDT
jgi:hypothetical protein